jgi:hypothetical protein
MPPSAPYDGARMTAEANARAVCPTRHGAALATAIYACHQLARMFADSSSTSRASNYCESIHSVYLTTTNNVSLFVASPTQTSPP